MAAPHVTQLMPQLWRNFRAHNKPRVLLTERQQQPRLTTIPPAPLSMLRVRQVLPPTERRRPAGLRRIAQAVFLRQLEGFFRPQHM